VCTYYVYVYVCVVYITTTTASLLTELTMRDLDILSTCTCVRVCSVRVYVCVVYVCTCVRV
jgi:hypothetical protein